MTINELRADLAVLAAKHGGDIDVVLSAAMAYDFLEPVVNLDLIEANWHHDPECRPTRHRRDCVRLVEPYQSQVLAETPHLVLRLGVPDGRQ